MKEVAWLLQISLSHCLLQDRNIPFPFDLLPSLHFELRGFVWDKREDEGKREHVQDNGICPSLESLHVTTNTQAQPIFSMLHWKMCRWNLLTQFLKCQRSWPPGQYWPSIWSQAPELWCWSPWCSFAGEVHVLKEKPLALMALAGNFRVEGQIAFPACPLPTSRDSSSSAFALLVCQVACLRRRD